nr:unnamed protein product [Spirometra erinaceieuropaei]
MYGTFGPNVPTTRQHLLIRHKSRVDCQPLSPPTIISLLLRRQPLTLSDLPQRLRTPPPPPPPQPPPPPPPQRHCTLSPTKGRRPTSHYLLPSPPTLSHSAMWTQLIPVLIAFSPSPGLAGHLRIHRTEVGEPVPGAPTCTRRISLHCPHCLRTLNHRTVLLSHMRIQDSGIHRTIGTPSTSCASTLPSPIQTPSPIAPTTSRSTKTTANTTTTTTTTETDSDTADLCYSHRPVRSPRNRPGR